MSIIVLNGEITHRSRNLRGILDHARRTPVIGATVMRKGHGEATLFVRYADGSVGVSEFASYAVCKHWISCRRSWGLTLKTELSDGALFSLD